MKRALVSVSDKTGLVEFVQGLVDCGYEIISTGGTKKALEAAGIHPIGISDVTGFPEIMDGRVKTLHPKVHGALLCVRSNPDHVRQLKELGIEYIDLVCVNLYPFKETIMKPDVEIAEAIENIDIGGPSMIRSAAKNFKDVLIVTDPKDYDAVLEAIREDKTDFEFRMNLAYKAYSLTGSYDAMISRYFADQVHDEFPDILNISLKKTDHLRYGENSQQSANAYVDPYVQHSLLDYEQLHGKEISFNNVNDLYGAVACVREFGDQLVTVAIKQIDKETALEMKKTFLEIIAAPDFDDDALEVLEKKKNLRLLKLKNLDARDAKYDIKYLEGKALVQELNTKLIDEMKVVTKKQPTEAELSDMEFGLKVVKYVKSNAIVLVKDGCTLAVGGGQTSRIWALENAIHNNPDKDFHGAVLASDAFFPFSDCAQVADEAGIKAIVQPGGSVRDQESIDYCDEHDMTMVFNGYRHFRH